MLKKLFKYEFRFYRRWILLSYAILAAVLTLARVSTVVANYIAETKVAPTLTAIAFLPMGFLYIMSGIVVVLVPALPVILLAFRFYKNLVRDEGYLSFTLPVKPSSHLFCKTLTSFLFTVVSFLVAAVLLFLAVTVGPGFTSSLKSVGRELSTIFSDADAVIFAVEILLSMLAALVAEIVLIAFSISVGQLSQKHKLLFSILAYLVVNFGINILSNVISVFFMIFMTASNLIISDLLTMTPVFVSGIALNLIVAIVLYLLSSKILTDKLNLE